MPFTKQTKSLMTHLIDETEEDYQTLVKTLESLGVTVRRPSKDRVCKRIRTSSCRRLSNDS